MNSKWLIRFNDLKRSVGIHKRSFQGIPAPLETTNVLFIHIPKNAGSSISKALYNDYQTGHRTITEFQSIDPEWVDQAWSFAIYRHPLDRLVSAHTFLVQGGYEGVWIDSRLGASLVKDFNDFVPWLAENPWMMRYWHFHTQQSYICNENGELQIDTLFGMNDMNEISNQISARTGKECPIKHINPSKRRNDWQSYYTDNTRKIAEEIYADDFKLESHIHTPLEIDTDSVVF